MITNIKSINVFPLWGCCSVHDSDRTGLMSCCCFGHYFLRLCSSNAFTLHDHRKLEACVVGISWFSLNLSCETLLTALVSTLHLSLLSRNPQKRLLFCEALFSMLPSPNNADVVFTCRVWGFFCFYTKHMIGSFNFLVWTIGCVSAVLVTWLLGIFHKYYTTTTPSKKPRQTKNPNLLFCKAYRVSNKMHWTKQKYEQLPVGAFFCLQVCLWFISVSSKANLVHELHTNTHGPGNHGVQQHAVTLLDCFGGQMCQCSKVSWQAVGWSHRAVALLTCLGAAGSLVPSGSPAGMDPGAPTGCALLFSGVACTLTMTSH